MTIFSKIIHNVNTFPRMTPDFLLNLILIKENSWHWRNRKVQIMGNFNYINSRKSQFIFQTIMKCKVVGRMFPKYKPRKFYHYAVNPFFFKAKQHELSVVRSLVISIIQSMMSAKEEEKWRFRENRYTDVGRKVGCCWLTSGGKLIKFQVISWKYIRRMCHATKEQNQEL